MLSGRDHVEQIGKIVFNPFPVGATYRPNMQMDSLEWLEKYWHHYHNGQRIGDMFVKEMEKIGGKGAVEFVDEFRKVTP